MKTNEMHYFSNLFDKALYMFRMLACSGCSILADANRTRMTNTYCLYTVLRYF